MRPTELQNGESIDAVLSAERDAEAAVERVEEEAQATIERARERARRIRERTDRRIASINAGVSARTDRLIAELRAEDAERRAQMSERAHDPEVIRAAAARVVDWLLGGVR
jgi:vacuolar-type H+-ATPase subunit H